MDRILQRAVILCEWRTAGRATYTWILKREWFPRILSQGWQERDPNKSLSFILDKSFVLSLIALHSYIHLWIKQLQGESRKLIKVLLSSTTRRLSSANNLQPPEIIGAKCRAIIPPTVFVLKSGNIIVQNLKMMISWNERPEWLKKKI